MTSCFRDVFFPEMARFVREHPKDLIVGVRFDQRIEKHDLFCFSNSGKISVCMPAPGPRVHLQDFFHPDAAFFHLRPDLFGKFSVPDRFEPVKERRKEHGIKYSHQQLHGREKQKTPKPPETGRPGDEKEKDGKNGGKKRAAETNPAFIWSIIQSFRVDLLKPNFCSTTKVL